MKYRFLIYSIINLKNFISCQSIEIVFFLNVRISECIFSNRSNSQYPNFNKNHEQFKYIFFLKKNKKKSFSFSNHTKNFIFINNKFTFFMDFFIICGFHLIFSFILIIDKFL